VGVERKRKGKRNGKRKSRSKVKKKRKGQRKSTGHWPPGCRVAGGSWEEEEE